MGGDRLAELAAELLLRGVSTEKVLAVLEQGERAEGSATASPVRRRQGSTQTPGGPSTRPPGPGYVTHEQVLGVLAEAVSLTISEILARFPDAKRPAIVRHVRRGIEMGNMVQVGKEEPFGYMLTKAGRALVKHQRQAEPEASGEPPPGNKLSYASVVQRLRELGPSSAPSMSVAFGVSEQAVRMHMRRGVYEKTIQVHTDTTPRKWSVIKGATLPVQKKTGPPRSRDFAQQKRSVPKLVLAKGEGDQLIVGALRASGKPLDLKGFVEAVPVFQQMRYGTVGVAISTALKRKFIKRVSPGFYDLPDRGRQPGLPGIPEAGATAPKSFGPRDESQAPAPKNDQPKKQSAADVLN